MLTTLFFNPVFKKTKSCDNIQVEFSQKLIIMKSVAKLLNKVIRTCGSEQLVLYMRIADNWKHIVGEHLFLLTSLDSIKRSVIIINAIGSSSMLIKGQENLILNRLNNIVKRDFFTKIIIKHCLHIEHLNVA